jgi:hypothetical protein
MSEEYFSWLTPITNMGASADGAEMITFLAPPNKKKEHIKLTNPCIKLTNPCIKLTNPCIKLTNPWLNKRNFLQEHINFYI